MSDVQKAREALDLRNEKPELLKPKKKEKIIYKEVEEKIEFKIMDVLIVDAKRVPEVVASYARWSAQWE